MLTTDQKGAIAETAIAHAATKLGVEVYRPIDEGRTVRHDLPSRRRARQGAVQVGETDSFSARTQLHLRLAARENNQRLGIRWVKDYEFAATLRQHQGAIAQLGERLDGIQKVAGSSPAGSTLFSPDGDPAHH
jgi:hypothetical protein